VSAYLGAVALLVRDYVEARDWYVNNLGFILVEDRDMGGGKRWVVVAPPGAREARLLLAKAVKPEEVAQIGNQAGGRVFLFLHTGDFARDHAAMKAKGVRFLEEPRRETYGTVAVFADLYGNKWDLIEPAG
jgi:catechol 2,3-dioxygenase-like lactoylglutathione lyase family enzyme